MSNPRLVYVQQFGGFWSLSVPAWIGCCRRGAAGLGYDLDAAGKRLSGKPKGIRKNSNRPGFWSARSDARFVQPLDWAASDYVEEIENIR